MDGMAATRILRGMGVRIPIVALTGNALTEDQNRFLEAGADHVIIKPIDSNHLRRVLSMYFPDAVSESAAHSSKP
jgi:CheY-like chemotaxis protein